MTRISKSTAVAIRQHIISELERTTCVQADDDGLEYRAATNTEAVAMASVVMEVLHKRGLTAQPYVDYRLEVER